MKITRKHRSIQSKHNRSKYKKSNTKKNNTIKKYKLKSTFNSIKLVEKKMNKKQLGGNKIEKKVHQIWFGGGDPKWRKYLFDKNAETCKKMGYKHHLWIESDRTEENFPSTYKYQQICLEIGAESGQNRFAQVADLARIEIIYKYGGVYIDSIFEISEDFLSEMTRLSELDKYEFIGANEDPCGLDCEGFEGRKYLTNSFFAGPKGSSIFKRLLEPERLANIDYESQYVNRTTGPYYIRSVITDDDISNDLIYLFNTEDIFPFNVNATAYRPINPNKCLYRYMEDDEGNEIAEDDEGSENYIKIKDGQYLLKDCLKTLRKRRENLLAIYHSGLGGTWSF